MSELYYESAITQAQWIKEKKISARELLELHFSRVDAVNPIINAIIWEDRERAWELAGQQDALLAKQGVDGLGSLYGVPITVKEAFDLVGSPSTWGNPALAENRPDTDADVVQRYKSAGANIFGKTNVPLNLVEWQSFNEIYGTTLNPWDLTRTPGGSSGGSSAALATGMTALEAGSDIGSSIRNPAHYCGVFGLKPTWNVIPLRGHMPPGWVSDIDIAVTGPMARSAQDLNLGFNVLVGPDQFGKNAWRTHCPDDRRVRLKEFRVAIKLDDGASPVDKTYIEQLALFADKLAAEGATVVFDCESDIQSQEYFDLYLKLLGAARSVGVTDAEIEQMRNIPREEDNPESRKLLDRRIEGMMMSHGEWQVTHNERRKARLKFDRFFEDYDILLCPVCASTAFPIDEMGGRYERKITVNDRKVGEVLQMFWAGYSGVVGLPSAVGPISLLGGLPVGYQAIAGHGKDRTALAFSMAVEREIGGFTPPPDFI